jgi:hypothetical protein
MYAKSSLSSGVLVEWTGVHETGKAMNRVASKWAQSPSYHVILLDKKRDMFRRGATVVDVSCTSDKSMLHNEASLYRCCSPEDGTRRRVARKKFLLL